MGSVMLSDAVVAWLLESVVPSIRYLTMVDLLGRSAAAPEVLAARAAIMESGPIPDLLAKQTQEGNWPGERSYYTPKYTSTHWTMLLLDELSVDGHDERFRRGADFMLTAVGDSLAQRVRRAEYGWSCLFANVLHYAARAGFVDDPRLQDILRFVEIDLGQRQCACASNDGQRCGWGVARSLWGAAAVPLDARSPALQRAIERGIEFLVGEFSLAEANYPVGRGKIHPLWFRLSFPLFYQSDILFALRALNDAGAIDHPGAGPALAWLAGKQQENGCWRGSNPFRTRAWSSGSDPEETDRWVTLQSASLLVRPRVTG